jgi:hypothetical protein
MATTGKSAVRVDRRQAHPSLYPTLEDAKAWALRCPVGMASADVLEVRQLTAEEDIPPRYLDLAASVAPNWTASILKKR